MATKPRKRITSAGNIRWEIVIRKVGYPQVSKMFKTEKEAKVWSVETETAINRGTYDFGDKIKKESSDADVVSTSMTLESLFTVYFEKFAGGLKDGGRRDRQRIKPIVEYMGSVKLIDLGRDKITEYVLKRLNTTGFRRKTKISGETVKHEVNLIKRVFNVAIDLYNLTLPYGNPAVLPRTSPVTKKLKGVSRDRILSDSEEVRLLAECSASRNSELLNIVQLAIETAMRKNEILTMTWDQIDLDRGVIDIPSDIAKTGDKRFALLTQTAVQILSKMKGAGSGSGLVFESKYDAVQRCFTRACQRADIKDFRFHDLRHTAITRTHDRTGMQMLHLMVFSGHKSTQMVKRYYTDNVDDVVSELNKTR
jgi:integrase